MKWRMNEIIVFMTASNEDEAVRIGRALVEARLAGCVNIIRNIRSIYRWQGKIEDEKEVLMVAKTTAGVFWCPCGKSERTPQLHGSRGDCDPDRQGSQTICSG